jgi:hypothetical protein
VITSATSAAQAAGTHITVHDRLESLFILRGIRSGRCRSPAASDQWGGG